MFLDIRLQRWAASLRRQSSLPLRLELWDGRRLDLGDAPRVTIRLPRASAVRYLLKPTLDRLGQAYVEGQIEIDGRLDDIIRVGSALARSAFGPARPPGMLHLGRHSARQDAADIRYHYDVSNDFYRAWLGDDMVYSCAYFENGDEDLETAQRRKIDHILTKIRLQPGQRLLDIGCGWGALVLRAAAHWGARCTGITLSERQYELARERVARAGLSGQVEIRLQDYREVEGRYDRITSVGMFEHVGLRNMVPYFSRIAALLEDDGVAMNHGITSTDSGSAETGYGAGAFIGKYVFPHGELPHVGFVLQAMQDGGLEALDVENLRRHYALTCALWAERFERQTASLRTLVDERRFRIWRLYLAGCAHAFEQGWISIHQVVAVKTRAGAGHMPWTRHYMYRGFSATAG